jgi:hypothetical protein
VLKLLENIREHAQTTVFSHDPNQVLAIVIQLLTTDGDERRGEGFWR